MLIRSSQLFSQQMKPRVAASGCKTSFVKCHLGSEHKVHLSPSGRHYWYNISADMSCDDFFPVFLLYNRDRLTGFGWVARGNANSPRYEHPSSNSLKVSQTRDNYKRSTSIV